VYTRVVEEVYDIQDFLTVDDSYVPDYQLYDIYARTGGLGRQCAQQWNGCWRCERGMPNSETGIMDVRESTNSETERERT